MRRITVLLATLSFAISGLVFSPAQAAAPVDGTYLCATGAPSSSTPNYTITNGVVSEGSTCVGSVVIPAGITSIGSSAFRFSDITSIDIPSSVTSLGTASFNGTQFLTSIDIPSSVTSIGDFAFSTTSLTSIHIPSSVTFIGIFAFSDSPALTSATIAPGVTSIPPNMFDGATALTSVTIPSSVTSISSVAFGRTALTSVTIPSSVTSIGILVFSGSTALNSVYFLGDAPYVMDATPFSNIASGAKAYINSGASGFGSPGSIWNGLIVTLDDESEVTQTPSPTPIETEINSPEVLAKTGIATPATSLGAIGLGLFAIFLGSFGLRRRNL